jgi:uncharacterized repeat protein (TIGR01451 family)
MPVVAKLFSLFGSSRFSIAKAFGVLSLLIGLLASLAMPQLAFAQTQITNTASISAPPTVTNTNTATTCVAGTCTATDNDTITASVPTVSKAFSPSTISAGGTSLLVITFTNSHKLVSATFSTAFVDVYPAGMLNATTTLAATTCIGGAVTATPGAGQLSLPVGTLIAPNASCSVSAVVTSITSPQAANTIPAGSLTTSVGANPTLVNATLTVTPSADLAIVKTASTSTPNAGGTFTYTIVIVNNGPSNVSNATWTDTLPAGLGTITNVVASAGITGAAVGNTISGASTLASGQSATLTFQVSVAPGTTGTLTNTASVTAPVGTTDPTPGNNTSSVPVTVNLVADLAIAKTASTSTPNAGGTFTYTIVIVNNGPSNVSNATWTDTLPAGLGTITNVVASAGITGAAVGNTISGASTLASGQSATLTFQVSVAPGATGTLTNTASVTAPVGTTDPTPGNNTSSVPVTIGQVANLSVAKTNGTTSVIAGGTTAYTITFSNGGPSAANGAVVRDAQSAGLQCTSVTCTATTGGASCPSSMLPQGAVVLSGATNFFAAGETIGTFPANSTVTLIVNCNVTATGQ